MAHTNGTNGTSYADFGPSSTIPLFLDGKEITTEKTFDVTSPNDNKVCWKCSAASEQDALNAVASAQKAFKTWSKTKPSQRRDILLKAAELLKQSKETAYRHSNVETGAVSSMTDFEFNLAIEGCLTMGGLIQSVNGSVLTPGEEGKSALMLREPYGVILAIAPWNAPHVLGMVSGQKGSRKLQMLTFLIAVVSWRCSNGQYSRA